MQKSSFTDKKGSLYFMGECDSSFKESLNMMYDVFSPKAITQGLPPANDEQRRTWVNNLLGTGINFAAWLNEQIIGHAALMPDYNRRDAEYIIFILSEFRNLGLGSKLSDLSVAKAKDLNINLLWLTVESINFRAIRVYRKVGFQFCDEGELERTMQLYL
jgi:diamine N-acetyltransferase